jgi:hypothetical protein
MRRAGQVPDDMDVDQEEKLINEGLLCPTLMYLIFAHLPPEYKTWKKNSPFLYDMILRYTFVMMKSCSFY